MDHSDRPVTTSDSRLRLIVNGVVQGVGFRPFVYRLAVEEQLAGSVSNGSTGVTIEIEGSAEAITNFQTRLGSELPPLARIDSIVSAVMPVAGQQGFRIRESEHFGNAATLIPPDVATCDDCLHELFDPSDRRYQYPFINCTNCGPRYTIVDSIPYDRPFTSMKRFTMCPDCQREYDDPANRRFHAQPNGCHLCGPGVSLHVANGSKIENEPIGRAVELLRQGNVLAIRGVGGFHLAVDATNETAVVRLRHLKGRAEKPFALMAPDLSIIERFCHVSDAEARLLRSPERPIVLLERLQGISIAPSVAPHQRNLGFMLPYTPLHHLLLRHDLTALVMTSGNLSEEPIAIGNAEAFDRLNGIADFFLLHDREILQRCDDSITRIQSGAVRMLRRSRGYVPLPVAISEPVSQPILAVGGELKNAIALGRQEQIFLSQHIGDLDNPSALSFFEASIAHLQKMLEIEPTLIAHDLHPEYLSTQWAEKQPLPAISVQHHHAHLASVLVENKCSGPALGLILDGSGYGPDGTIWGGELLHGDVSNFERLAWMQPVPMPGGTLAIRQPWRMAVAYLHQVYGERMFDLGIPLIEKHRAELPTLVQMMQTQFNAPLTSSCGRLFDAVAAILGFDRDVAYEAQAAIELEMLGAAAHADSHQTRNEAEDYTLPGPVPTSTILESVVEEFLAGKPREIIAANFHLSVVSFWVKAVLRARELSGCNLVALSGGVFQNNLLFEMMVRRLEAERFEVLTHHLVPTNDGGIALGQVMIANARLRRTRG